eukprot:TRINITY_DN7392_c0_g1_i2.p4 TRINITY_DN7392_c0_g1~~TRINITY_DN7392_c0_g1_i2.p4  ORF type:complete len:100 (-),score=23.23 TRINITY_DN7392_c0_g1_i2:96-395(-)
MDTVVMGRPSGVVMIYTLLMILQKIIPVIQMVEVVIPSLLRHLQSKQIPFLLAHIIFAQRNMKYTCLLYTSDAADDTPCVDLGGRRIIKKKKKTKKHRP